MTPSPRILAVVQSSVPTLGAQQEVWSTQARHCFHKDQVSAVARKSGSGKSSPRLVGVPSQLVLLSGPCLFLSGHPVCSHVASTSFDRGPNSRKGPFKANFSRSSPPIALSNLVMILSVLQLNVSS